MSAIKLLESDYEFQTLRASGPGGQHVNKVETAVQLRFDISQSSLRREDKDRLLQFRDHRISKDGVILIKAQRFRSQDKNKQDAVKRLRELIQKATEVKKRRVATKPGRAAKERRLKDKKKSGDKKNMRSRPSLSD